MTITSENEHKVRIDGKFVQAQARAAARLFFMPLTAPIKEIIHPREELNRRIKEVEDRIREVEANSKVKVIYGKRATRSLKEGKRVRRANKYGSR